MNLESIQVFTCVLSTFGTLSNLMSLFICMRKSIRNTPTFVFLAFMAVMNILPLATMVLFSFELHNFSIHMCKTLMSLLFIGCQSSVYLLVCFFFFFNFFNIKWKYF